MKSVLTALLTGLAALLLVSCYSGAKRPHSTCHILTTQINSYNQSGLTGGSNAATKARLTQEYKDLDCDGQ